MVNSTEKHILQFIIIIMINVCNSADNIIHRKPFPHINRPFSDGLRPKFQLHINTTHQRVLSDQNKREQTATSKTYSLCVSVQSAVYMPCDTLQSELHQNSVYLKNKNTANTYYYACKKPTKTQKSTDNHDEHQTIK